MSNAELPELKVCSFFRPVRIEGWHKGLDGGGWYIKDARNKIVIEVCFDENEQIYERPITGGNPATRALVALINNDLVSSAAVPTIYADGFCARCSDLAYPLTRALEATGVPTGADNWQQSYGPNKVKALSDYESCLRRLLLALEEGKPEVIKDRVNAANHYIEFHAAIRRRLTAQAQQRESSQAPAPASSGDGVDPQCDYRSGGCANEGRIINLRWFCNNHLDRAQSVRASLGDTAHRCPHFEPKGEDSGGAYNAQIIIDVTNELLDTATKEKIAAKPTAWYSLLIKQLVQRIANLRVMLNAAKAQLVSEGGPNYANAIKTLRELRGTTDPAEIQRQKESWAQLQADLAPPVSEEGAVAAARDEILRLVHDRYVLTFRAEEIKGGCPKCEPRPQFTTEPPTLREDVAAIIRKHCSTTLHSQQPAS